MSDFAGRIVLVTGAAGPGIGGACARAFARRGATIVVSDRSQERAIATARAVEDEFRASAHPVLIDVSDEDSVVAGVAKVNEEVGTVDVLVNNAAVVHRSPVLETSLDSWNTVFGVCVTGAFLMTRACLPGMIDLGRGSIVNIASVAAWTGSRDNIASYSAAKAALLGLTRAVASEVGEHGVRVNAVAPGHVPNPSIEQFFDADWVESIRESTPLRRTTTPDDVAQAVLHLASDASAAVTGDVLNVSGGLYYHA